MLFFFALLILIVLVINFFIHFSKGSTYDNFKEILLAKKKHLLHRYERLQKLIDLKVELNNKIKRVSNFIFRFAIIAVTFSLLASYYILVKFGFTSYGIEGVLATFTFFLGILYFVNFLINKEISSLNEIANRVDQLICHKTYKYFGRENLVPSLIDNQNEMMFVASQIDEIDQKLNTEYINI